MSASDGISSSDAGSASLNALRLGDAGDLPPTNSAPDSDTTVTAASSSSSMELTDHDSKNSKKRPADETSKDDDVEAKSSVDELGPAKKAKIAPTFESERVELFQFDFDKHLDSMAEMQGNPLVMEQFANAQPRSRERVARQARMWHDRWHASPPNPKTAFMGGYAMYLKPSATGLPDRIFLGTVVTGGSELPNSAECAICCQAAYFRGENRYASSKEDLDVVQKELKGENKRGVVQIWGLRVATEVGQLMREKHLPLFMKAHPNIKTIDSTASNPASQKILDRLGFRKLDEQDLRYGTNAAKGIYILDLYPTSKEG